MPDDACKPDMAAAEPFDVFQVGFGDAGEFAGSVFFECPVFPVCRAVVAPEPREHLVYDCFGHDLNFIYKCAPFYCKISA